MRAIHGGPLRRIAGREIPEFLGAMRDRRSRFLRRIAHGRRERTAGIHGRARHPHGYRHHRRTDLSRPGDRSGTGGQHLAGGIDRVGRRVGEVADRRAGLSRQTSRAEGQHDRDSTNRLSKRFHDAVQRTGNPVSSVN